MGSEEARNHGLYCGNKLPPVSGMDMILVVMMMVMRIFMSMIISTVTMIIMT